MVMTTRKRAVIYIRYSTTNQREESAEAQIRACEEYAKRHGLIIVKIYQDLGMSASKSIHKRKDFNNMINDSQNNDFDVVLVHKVDRFARAQIDYLKYEQKLNQNNVDLISVTQPFTNSPEGKIAKSVMVVMAEIFSENLGNEIRVKNYEYAKKGLYLGGIVPYGFDIKIDENDKTKRRYVVNQDEATVVKTIFKLYSLGYSAKQIVDHLYSQGIKDREGRHFQTSKIWRMIKNDIYIGTYSYNKKYNDKTTVKIEQNHEAIISQDLWNKTVERAKQKKSKPRARKMDKPKYILTGLMKCGCCGHSFCGKGGNKLYRYYKCASFNHKHNGFCPNAKSLNKDKIEERITAIVLKQLFTDELINLYADEILNNIVINSEEKKEIQRLKATKKEIENKMERILNLYINGKFDEDKLNKMQEEAQNELEVIVQKLYEHEVTSKVVTKEDVLNQLKQIKKELSENSSDLLEYILNLAIDSVIVNEEAIDVYFNIYNPYPSKETGIISTHILDKTTNGLTLKTLSQLKNGVKIYRLNNGMCFGHKQIKRD